MIRTDGTTMELRGDGARGALTIDQMYDTVLGPVHGVKDPYTHRVFMLINEEASTMGLPVNDRATLLALEHGCRCEIFGDVVVPATEIGGDWY